MKYSIGSARHAFQPQLPAGWMKQSQGLGRAITDICVRELNRMRFQLPTRARIGFGLIRTSLIFTPDAQSHYLRLFNHFFSLQHPRRSRPHFRSSVSARPDRSDTNCGCAASHNLLPRALSGWGSHSPAPTHRPRRVTFAVPSSDSKSPCQSAHTLAYAEPHIESAHAQLRPISPADQPHAWLAKRLNFPD